MEFSFGIWGFREECVYVNIFFFSLWKRIKPRDVEIEKHWIGDRWRFCVDVCVFVHNICVLVFHVKTFGIMQVPVGGMTCVCDVNPPPQKSSPPSFPLSLLCWELFEFVIRCLTESFISIQQLEQRNWFRPADLNVGVIQHIASRGHCRTFFCCAQRLRSSETYSKGL